MKTVELTPEKVAEDINKAFGEGSLVRLGSAANMKVETISTGSITLDLALGGGVPRGRIVEIYGPESSGKTTVCLHIIAESQKLGGMNAFIDMEHALDPSYAEKVGVNLQDLWFAQPDNGEQALEMCERLVRTGLYSTITIDSVAALVPQKEIEGEMGDAVVGLQARLMSQALRKLAGVVKQAGTVVIFTNQLRQKIGVVFGSPETTTGGMALKFYASQRLDIRRIQSLKNGDEIVGNRTRVRIVKNKVAPPFRVAEFDIMYNEGISRTGEILDLGVKAGAITKRGSFLYHGDDKLGQGRENAREFLRLDPALADALTVEIKEKSSGISFKQEPEDEDDTSDIVGE
jgi:recombination protein RecA